MSSDTAALRLGQERRAWRKDHPFGFVAKPATTPDGATDMFKWECLIPGVEGTCWEGGLYPVVLHFSKNYPDKPPVACFPAGFFHLNVYPDGHVCLDILQDDEDMGGKWAPSISMKQVLLGLQELLDNPNERSPAQEEARSVFASSRREYDRRVSRQARQYAAPD